MKTLPSPSLVGCSSMNIHETHETHEFVFHKLTNLCWHPYYQIRSANKIHWLMYYRLQVSRRSHRLELAWRGCKFGGSKSNPRNGHNLLPQSLGSQTPKRSHTADSKLHNRERICNPVRSSVTATKFLKPWRHGHGNLASESQQTKMEMSNI